VEDDHVDRPGVEVRQRMKLTGTNSSIGLIVLIACVRFWRSRAYALWGVLCEGAGRPATQDRAFELRSKLDQPASHEKHAFCRPGGYGGATAPDPIPNSAVKRPSADGTSSQDAGE
jgi:hypothetical protein